MVDARDFGEGQTDVFALTLVWKRDLHRLGQLISKLAIADSAEALLWLEGLQRYGRLMTTLATTARGNPRWSELQHAASKLRLELAERAARAEVEAQRHVATE